MTSLVESLANLVVPEDLADKMPEYREFLNSARSTLISKAQAALINTPGLLGILQITMFTDQCMDSVEEKLPIEQYRRVLNERSIDKDIFRIVEAMEREMNAVLL